MKTKITLKKRNVVFLNYLVVVMLMTGFFGKHFVILLPYVEYSINYEKIVTYFCQSKNEVNNECKGICYLNTQINKKVEEESGSNKESPPEKGEKKITTTSLSTLYRFENVDGAIALNNQDLPESVTKKPPTPPPKTTAA